VIVTARSADTFAEAKKTLAGTGLDVVQCDVSDLAQLDALYSYIKKTYSGLDVLFANAGIVNFKPTGDVDEQFYDSIMGPNVKGLYFSVQKALPLLNDGSAVMLNASVLATQGLPGSSVYSASKAAVRSFARTWTAEIPPSKTRFNVLSPGYTFTPIFGKLGLSEEQTKQFAAHAVEKIPAKRIAKSEEMATIALFLASSDSSYLAGADVVADGGMGQI
jgi:NAD(P)-dependent dehydrogenase (short-subunit alcohol dehydrogenase family)